MYYVDILLFYTILKPIGFKGRLKLRCVLSMRNKINSYKKKIKNYWVFGKSLIIVTRVSYVTEKRN